MMHWSLRTRAILFFLVAVAGVATAQGKGPFGIGLDPHGNLDAPTAEEWAEIPAVFRGLVLDRYGAPALGAVVVSSAGGQAVTRADGSYRLEALVPADAQSVQITAVGAGQSDLRASARVEISTSSRFTSVDPLTLAVSTGCPSSWLPTFSKKGSFVDAPVFALTVFDDGSGPALYAGGQFTTIAGAPIARVAKWDGVNWSALGSGMNNSVLALAVFDDGTGPALFAGGTFTVAGGTPVNRIAKWNGTSWSALGIGLNDGVNTLTVFDDGGGPALYVGGWFTNAGGVGSASARIARWNGSSWSAVGSGLGGGLSEVRALAAFDDGGGAALYAAGTFNVASGAVANRVAKWNGTSWSALGAGIGSILVNALAVFDDGSGPALYAGGNFDSAGGSPADNIARWDGSSWSTLTGTDSPIYVLHVFDDGSGPALFAGGIFTTAGGTRVNSVAKWSGSSWSALNVAVQNEYSTVLAMTVFDDGLTPPGLIVGGTFARMGGVPASRLAEWSGTDWTAIGSSGLPNDWVGSLASFDDGDGPALFAGGGFTRAGPNPASRIAHWRANRWAAPGSGFDLSPADLHVFDDGSGDALFAGGNFTTAGGSPANRIAKWNGSSWAALGNGMNDWVFALTDFDDGGGSALYAGGSFLTADGLGALRIAKWNGATWSQVGNGFNGGVHSLAVYDDGSGPGLYAGGYFSKSGNKPIRSIARWNGSEWEVLHAGTDNAVYALAVFDAGSGPELYAGGAFTVAGDNLVNYIARWKSPATGWQVLQSGMNGPVYALEVFDDGTGPALYAAGAFTTAGGLAAKRIARWNGSNWSALGKGMDERVYALETFDDGSGDSLFAGGLFTKAGGFRDARIARWGCE